MGCGSYVIETQARIGSVGGTDPALAAFVLAIDGVSIAVIRSLTV
jgi:hypothetical protein